MLNFSLVSSNRSKATSLKPGKLTIARDCSLDSSASFTQGQSLYGIELGGASDASGSHTAHKVLTHSRSASSPCPAVDYRKSVLQYLKRRTCFRGSGPRSSQEAQRRSKEDANVQEVDDDGEIRYQSEETPRGGSKSLPGSQKSSLRRWQDVSRLGSAPPVGGPNPGCHSNKGVCLTQWGPPWSVTLGTNSSVKNEGNSNRAEVSDEVFSSSKFDGFIAGLFLQLEVRNEC